MFPKCLLFFTITVQICWAYSVLSSNEQFEAPEVISQNDVGEPLFLTPFIKCNQTESARDLSSVRNLWNKTDLISYSGYLTVDEEYNSNLFFWFFGKSGNDSQKAPVLLWLQGGPGSSSMLGLFKQNGPFSVPEDNLKERDFSWTNEYNVLYIDQPVGAGFSFTDDERENVITVDKAAEHLCVALTQFFQLFPELKSNAFYITGEGFAGHFITALSNKIHNLKKTDSCSFNLKGIFLISSRINGFYNGLANFCYQVGIIDSRTKTELEVMENNMTSYIESESWKDATSLMNDMFGKLRNNSLIDTSDFTKPLSCVEENYVDFLTKSETRNAIHVGNKTFDIHKRTIYNAFNEELLQSIAEWVESLLEHYPIAFVTGQLDIVVAYPLVLEDLRSLNWSGAKDYNSTSSRLLVDKELWEDYGYYKSAGNLKDILIRAAGYMVPVDQPRETFDVLKKFINNEL